MRPDPEGPIKCRRDDDIAALDVGEVPRGHNQFGAPTSLASLRQLGRVTYLRRPAPASHRVALHVALAAATPPQRRSKGSGSSGPLRILVNSSDAPRSHAGVVRRQFTPRLARRDGRCNRPVGVHPQAVAGLRGEAPALDDAPRWETPPRQAPTCAGDAKPSIARDRSSKVARVFPAGQGRFAIARIVKRTARRRYQCAIAAPHRLSPYACRNRSVRWLCLPSTRSLPLRYPRPMRPMALAGLCKRYHAHDADTVT